MHRLPALPLVIAALLAASGTAHAQHVTGGMGEPVRIGAFSAPGERIDGERRMAAPHGSRQAKAGTARRQGSATQAARPNGAPAARLPGRHLP
ncbi:MULTISPECIES: hypothetical protein [unclassified Cupriavidus]|uniref:hypothetical protein n=1 Tax=unclassified Cupriavidus TaxID=2640874 RepID=UPI001AEA9D74|nr:MULTISPECIES: hypothetical protein [unclassified Cupriavidus]MBP0628180.1 hypothetical protein [Cupriavidus sp. AcVe19-1a]MBP0636244.1 hypothetical protein [Cupriavidus sp. AcVe19-6a]